ncbi:MAG: hypothetical protein FWG70_02005 [Oscillospiraceae bacterium]|nr:hypothetical protein [Oscillospiraceae bacterium]
MKIGLTEVIILHDNNTPKEVSESMNKNGKKFFSALKENQAEGEIRITLGAFGEGFKLYASDVPVAAVRPVIKNFTNGNGVRNILDSVGSAIIEKGEVYSNSDESEHPERIVFVLTAFGRDNASKSFTYSQIADMVAHQSYVYKWKFLCLTNEPFITEQLGILPENVIPLEEDEENDFFADALDELAVRIKSIINE